MVRQTILAIAAAGLAAAPGVAIAGDVPILAATPEWVVAAPPIDTAVSTGGKPAFPLFDEQYLVDGARSTAYLDAAYAITNPEMLTRFGTIKVKWQPAHGDLAIHKIEILRGSERIDLTGNGTGMTVLRREAGLESQIIDGSLTAVRQVEGLRIGDILHVVFSVSDEDPLLGGHAAESMLLLPQPVRIGFGRARLVWPAAQKLNWKIMQPGVTAVPRAIAGGRKELVIAMPIAKLPEVPEDVPARSKPLPLVIASNFASWAELSAVMAPLYKTEGTIAEGSPLAKLVDGIAAASSDPVARIAGALKAVQGDVRYQLIALGTGNYQPQAPAHTWEIRYGDCKAKTLLLLAMLSRMGITAEPVLAHSRLGDVIPAMPAGPAAFDHVFVRAEVAGESFWLDGTGQGARLGDIRDVPRFGHVLPVRAANAALMPLPVRANARSTPSVDLVMDNSAGPHLPALFTLNLTYTGAMAEQMRSNSSDDFEEQMKKIAESSAKSWTGSTTIGKPSARYDAEHASWTMTVEGLAYPDWNFRDGRYQLEAQPPIIVSFSPDRSRSSWQQLPALIEKPWTAQVRKTFRFPDGVDGLALEGDGPLKLALPAVTYDRTGDADGRDVDR